MIKPNPVQNDTPLMNLIKTMCIQLTSNMKRVIPKWIPPIHHEKNEWHESKTNFETNVVESALNQVMGFINAMLGKALMNFHRFLGIWTLSG